MSRLDIVKGSTLCFSILALILLFLGLLDIAFAYVAVTRYGIYMVVATDVIQLQIERWGFPFTALLGLIKFIVAVVLLLVSLSLRKKDWLKYPEETFTIYWMVLSGAMGIFVSELAFLFSQAVSMWTHL